MDRIVLPLNFLVITSPPRTHRLSTTGPASELALQLFLPGPSPGVCPRFNFSSLCFGDADPCLVYLYPPTHPTISIPRIPPTRGWYG